MTERERTDLEKDMAVKARVLQEKLEALMDDDLTGWLDHIETLRDEGRMSEDELGWLDRVHTNILRFIPPALDNLDQVRWTLDKEKGGERGGRLEEDSS